MPMHVDNQPDAAAAARSANEQRSAQADSSGRLPATEFRAGPGRAQPTIPYAISRRYQRRWVLRVRSAALGTGYSLWHGITG